MNVVLDANAAVEVLLNRAETESLGRELSAAREILAPDLIFSECVNALWKYRSFGKLELELCETALRRLPGLITRLVSSVELFEEAFVLSRTLGKPAYDMFYLALARREDAVLLTLDKGLKKAAKRQGIRVLN